MFLPPLEKKIDLWWLIITGRLEAMLLEAKGSWEMAEKAYTSLLEDNPLDQVNSLNLMGKQKEEGNNQLVDQLLYVMKQKSYIMTPFLVFCYFDSMYNVLSVFL